MRIIAAVALSVLVAGPALSQTVSLPPQRFGPAPWWMDQPVIASTGYVRTELPSNRADITASFQAVAKTVDAATLAAANRVRPLGAQLASFGADKVRVETTFSMRPNYEQYRDKDGNLQSNERADKIESYQVNANLAVEIRDITLVERVYSAVLSAQPSSTQPVSFRLDPNNATKTQLSGLAVQDAAARARLAVEATGARLGSVKLIDPTGRACQTDVLVAGAPVSSGFGGGGQGARATMVLVDGQRVAQGPQVRPDIALPLQPPMQELTESACVVYSLAN